jgi:16S rRNA (cytosine1402-N4)-methyltransferase
VANYSFLEQIASDNGFTSVDAILLDLGYSSDQINDAKRGFSFQQPGSLDMRFDRNQSLTAQEVVNVYSEQKLKQIFKDYGEENFSFRIARALVQQRQNTPLTSTDQVVVVIQDALPKPVKHKFEDVARRIFQAIRIEVNHELENIERVLPQAVNLLRPQGRIAVIAFHSLEDRIVKKFFVEQSKDCVCPPEFPTCVCGKTSVLRVVTRKPVTASRDELQDNPRSKSAKLRVAEKI